MDEKERKEIMQSVLKRYEDRNGKQLYLRFPTILPKEPNKLLQSVREISPLVVKVHVARQNSAKFCMIDFETNKERNQALKELRTKIKQGQLAKYQVHLPCTENAHFLTKIAERKVQSVLRRRMKYQLRKMMKKDKERKLKGGERSCALRVEGLPRHITVMQLRNLFPNAIDIQMRNSKYVNRTRGQVAAITFPNPGQTVAAYKEEHILDNVKLRKTFITDSFKKRKNNQLKSTELESKNNDKANT